MVATAHLADPNPDAVSKYIIAIGHSEVFLSQAHQAEVPSSTGESPRVGLAAVPPS